MAAAAAAYLPIPFGPNVGAHKALFIKAAAEQCVVHALLFFPLRHKRSASPPASPFQRLAGRLKRSCATPRDLKAGPITHRASAR